MAQETLLQSRTESTHTVGKRCAGSVAEYRSMTPILNLPFEILEKICGFITDTDDLIELIHTCRRLRDVLKPDGKHWTLMIKRMWGNGLPRWFIPSKVIKPGWTHSTQRGLSVVFEKVVQHECFEFSDYSIKVFRSLCKQLCYNSLYQLCRDWTMNSCYVCLHDERCLAPGKVLLKREISGKKRQLMLCVPHARATIPLGSIRDKYGLKPVDVNHLQDASIPQRSRRLQQPCYFTDNVLNRCIEVYGNLSVCGHTKDARYRQMRARAIMDSLYRAGMLVHPGQKMHESVEVHNHYGYNTYSRDEFVFPSGYGPQTLEPEVYDTDSKSARSLAGDGVRIKSCMDNGVDEHPSMYVSESKVAKGKLRFTGVEFVPRKGIRNLAEDTESKHMDVRADADLARTTEEGQTNMRKGQKRDPAVCKQMEKLKFKSVGMQTGTDKVTTDMSTQPSNSTEMSSVPTVGRSIRRDKRANEQHENLSATGDPSDGRVCISGVGAVDIAMEPRASTGAIEGEGGTMLDTSRTGSGVYLCDMDIDNVRDKIFNIDADPVREPYGTDVSSTSGDNVNVIPERKYKEANVIGAHASNEASKSAQMHENCPQMGFLSPEMRAADSKQEQCGSSPDDSVSVLSRKRNGADIGKGRSTLHSHGSDVIVLSPKAKVVENGSGGCGTSKLHDSGPSTSSREKSTIESKDPVIGDIVAPTNNETIDSDNGVYAMSPERRAADKDTGKCRMSASHARGLIVPSSEMRTGHTDKAKCGKIPPKCTKVCPKISFLPRSAFGPPTKEKAHKAPVPGKQLARDADGTNFCSGDRGSHTCGLPYAQAWTTKGVGKASKSSYASVSDGKVREHMRNLGVHNKRLDVQNGNADVQVDTSVLNLPQKPVRALAQSAWRKAPVFAAEKTTQAAKSVLTTPTTQNQVHGLENTRITSTETDGGGWGEAIAKQIVNNGFVNEPIRYYSEKLHAHTPAQGLVHTLTQQPQAHNLTSQSAHASVDAQSTAHTHIQGVAHLHGHGHGSGLVSKPAVSMGRGKTGRGRGRRSIESKGPKLGPNSIWYTKFNVRLNPDVAEFNP